MSSMTITEALAEIKTLQKRIAKKQEFVKGFLYRQDGVKDPLDKDGGSFQALKRERQAIADLQTNIVNIRVAILKANMETGITVGKQSRTIEEWLVWRRDVAPTVKQFLADMQGSFRSLRQTASKQGLQVVAPSGVPGQPQDFVVNINEQELAAESEDIETILGTLDGQLSLKNATVMIDF